MEETWIQPLGREDPLEEGMATHSSVLAWRIPWTEETGWPATVHGVAQSQTQLKRLSAHTRMYMFTDDHVSPESVEFWGYG